MKGNKPDKEASRCVLVFFSCQKAPCLALSLALISRMIEVLREEKVPNKLEKGNWRAYEVDWVGIAGMR